MGEHGGGNELIAHAALGLAGLRAEQLVNDHHRFAQCHGSELHAAGDIAHGIDRRHIGLVVFVDHHRPILALCDTRGLQAQTGHQRHTAGGIQHGIGHHIAAVLEPHAQAVGRFGDGRDIGAQPQIDAGLAHLAGDEMADLLVEAAQHLLAAVQLGDPRAQAVEDGRELAGDVAAADHQQTLRKRLEVENGVGVDHMLAAFDIGQMRRAAGGDQDVLGGQALFSRFAVNLEHD